MMSATTTGALIRTNVALAPGQPSRWSATSRVRVRPSISPCENVGITSGSSPSLEADLSAGEMSHVEAGVVRATMVVSAHRETVLQAGFTAVAPGMGMMDVAPGERPLTALGRAGVVDDGQCATLGP